jgi:hypothetical protein
MPTSTNREVPFKHFLPARKHVTAAIEQSLKAGSSANEDVMADGIAAG